MLPFLLLSVVLRLCFLGMLVMQHASEHDTGFKSRCGHGGSGVGGEMCIISEQKIDPLELFKLSTFQTI